MAGRPKLFDERVALKKAATLFWEKGYEATSTEDLIRSMGLQRGSFYNSFNSKKKLFLNAIDFYEGNSLNEFKKILKESRVPMQVIRTIFLALADCPINEHKKGCFAGNTIAELSGIDEDLVENARNHLKALEEIFFEQIKTSQATGEIKTKVDAKLLGRYLLNLWNGINITRRVYPNKKLLYSLIEFQLEIIK
ncbi:MAG TPA: TetR/AcrR family transcriptional regulator [Nitrosopumilaceae archaeon]|nr:TetR/AcrR family transcriptional regulator [Nitrosopumilaceae archaeon]